MVKTIAFVTLAALMIAAPAHAQQARDGSDNPKVKCRIEAESKYSSIPQTSMREQVIQAEYKKCVDAEVAKSRSKNK